MSVSTVGELRELLEQFDDDRPILCVHQPSWPLAEVLDGLTVYEDNAEKEVEPCPVCERTGVHAVDCSNSAFNFTPDGEDDDDSVPVWLVLGGHPYDRSPYGPRWAFDGGY